jgi:tetratricopeptide (TPR) repeat protein
VQSLIKKAVGVCLGLIFLVFIVIQIPAVENALSWRVDAALTYFRVLIHPLGTMPPPKRTLPPPAVIVQRVSSTPTFSPANIAQEKKPNTTQTLTPDPSPTSAPLPPSIRLQSPKFERQDWNNCGPGALSLFLHFYGWEGNQFDIANVVKPVRADRNVNIDELAGYVIGNVDELNAVFRVGGTLSLLRKFLAAGFPVMIEETYILEEPFWYQDDLWAGHYLLLTGYNDSSKIFIAQDPLAGPDRLIDYGALDKNWQSFNRVYFLLYPPEKESEIKIIIGSDWDQDTNRQHALAMAQSETLSDPQNPFPWFNLGSNLVYFERYSEAAQAYDSARALTLPQRMLRYQFGPFLAYFHSGRIDDLNDLVKYALNATPNSEEALLWQGWAFYRMGNKDKALVSFQNALENHPGYPDALYAQSFTLNN